ncbi:MAG: DUF362 domain-containing protein [Armatimonadetes bacterium]|nr:DUF362 domain-containing protein [Armatimonadota bacterium]
MTDRERIITRRDFLRGAATAALTAAVGLPVAADPAAEKKARVVLMRDEGVLDAEGKINPSVLARMLDQAVAKALGKSKAADAWKSLVKPSDIVGIKTNHWNRLPTPPEIEKIIAERVASAGVSSDNVFCDDRGSKDRFAASTALINVRPARTHHWSGIGGCIKNYIILHPKPSELHPESCAALGSVWHLPVVKGKTRLNILVLLTPQFYGRGPQNFDPANLWAYKGLAVSTDPVALDAVGAHLLRAKRIAFYGEDKPITPTSHVVVADEKYGLGVSDLNKIELIRLGWKTDVLI